MSKRVANKHGAHAGSRCKRIRIGYWRGRNIAALREQQKGMKKDLEKAKEKDERNEILEAISYAGKQIKQLVPRTLRRRHQSR
jgi:hypothetical protein